MCQLKNDLNAPPKNERGLLTISCLVIIQTITISLISYNPSRLQQTGVDCLLWSAGRVDCIRKHCHLFPPVELWSMKFSVTMSIMPHFINMSNTQTMWSAVVTINS